ncbi:MAG TPA: hypothetical protein VN919_05515 [Xanthobacteraceae bacterium]|jgi:hypothetical protein|nr:hypothetical protein [Xanthobacteraceae bacterium]
MNRFDEFIVRHLKTNRGTDERSAARVVSALAAKPLPRQRHSWFRNWPSALLNNDFAPAWPRLAALACVALLGCTIGFFGPSTRAFQRTGWIVAIAQNSDDVSGFAFEPEPLTGAKP